MPRQAKHPGVGQGKGGGRKPGQPGGGNRKGVKNRTLLPTAAEKIEAIKKQIATAEYTGLTPLEFMLNVMRDAKLSVLTRLQAARDAAPYVHARLQSITVKGDPSQPLATTELTPEQYRDVVIKALKSI